MRGSVARNESRSFNPRSFLVRLLLVSIALLSLARVFSNDVVALLVPAIRAEVTALDDNISVLGMELTRDASGDLLQMRADLQRPRQFSKGIVYPFAWRANIRGWYRVHSNAMGTLQGCLIFLIAILICPQRDYREFLIRMLVAVPLVIILFAVDAPLDLLGNFQEAVARHVDPHAIRPLFVWDRFLEGGGSTAMAFAAIAISFARRSS
jgi:hypothetical protein